jgi:hypothetical protein
MVRASEAGETGECQQGSSGHAQFRKCEAWTTAMNESENTMTIQELQEEYERLLVAAPGEDLIAQMRRDGRLISVSRKLQAMKLEQQRRESDQAYRDACMGAIQQATRTIRVEVQPWKPDEAVQKSNAVVPAPKIKSPAEVLLAVASLAATSELELPVRVRMLHDTLGSVKPDEMTERDFQSLQDLREQMRAASEREAAKEAIEAAFAFISASILR